MRRLIGEKNVTITSEQSFTPVPATITKHTAPQLLPHISIMTITGVVMLIGQSGVRHNRLPI